MITAYQYRRARDDGSGWLWIGGLPARIDDEDILDVYEKFGKIVDVQIRSKADKSHCFAFVRFSNDDAAQKALQSTNGTSAFGMKRVKVEWSAPGWLGDNDERRPQRKRPRSPWRNNSRRSDEDIPERKRPMSSLRNSSNRWNDDISHQPRTLNKRTKTLRERWDTS